jgi:hypothetical protein
MEKTDYFKKPEKKLTTSTDTTPKREEEPISNSPSPDKIIDKASASPLPEIHLGNTSPEPKPIVQPTPSQPNITLKKV